ncbi:hypothetical protein LDENG_00164240 [Lucifuga dentata]|nr:hypothetical protein LDENG_00164240 [Lucifuga dentata]
MNYQLYQQILQENVRVSVCELKLKTKWVRQQDNDPKHTSRSIKECQSPDLNPIEMLWKDLKQQFMTGSPPTS